jgi:tRNA(Ile2) C34 agmatinyltransferase TiaS
MHPIYIGMDDTDNLESRGTGWLARAIAQDLSGDYAVTGVTRHQLLVDPRIPYTSHNSSAAIGLDEPETIDLTDLFERVKTLMLAGFVYGSDPGLCVATGAAAQMLFEFGQRAQRDVVTQAEARTLAETHDILFAGLGGSQDGVIGALAAVGLAACGEDGRYLLVGRSREVAGLQEISAVLGTGISAVMTLNGQPVSHGLVLADKLRPARRGAQPVLYVEWQEDHWQPVKLN